MKSYSLNKLEIDTCPVDLSIPRFFQLLTWTSLGKSVNSAGKSVFKLVAKFYKRLYGGDTNQWSSIFARSRLTFNLGNFTNFKAFFPVLSTRGGSRVFLRSGCTTKEVPFLLRLT